MENQTEPDRLKLSIYSVGGLIMSFLRHGCQQMGWPQYIQEIIMGVIIVLAVSLDRARR